MAPRGQKGTSLNSFIWGLHIALALQAFAGGAYKVFMFDEIATVPAMGALSSGGWGAIGWLEMLCAVLLIVPAALKRLPVLTPLAAAVLALESFALAGLYATYSLHLSATNPMVYVIAGGLLAAFVAYGRYKLLPRS